MSATEFTAAPGSARTGAPEGPRPTPRPATAGPAGGTGAAPSRARTVGADGIERVVRPRPTYLPALDGLRAVAVAAVVAYHLGRLGGGFLGVDVFFVISGFLITRLLIAERERTGGVALGNFWIRRFRRLLPALLVLLTAVALASRAWLPAWRLTGIRTDALSALFYVANWRFILSGQSYFAQGVSPSPLRHTWSLAIEEQFYLVWPLVVIGLALAFGRRHRLAILVTSGVLALGSAGLMAVAAGRGADLTRLYYGTDTRLFALCAGAWLAAWWDPVVADAPRPVSGRGGRPIARLATVVLVPMAVLLVVAEEDRTWCYRGGFQVMALLSVLAVAGLATGDGIVARALGTRPLTWVGRRSYGIYLWSWPVQVFAVEYFGLDGLVLDVTVVAVALGLAVLSFWLVEEPIRTGQRPAWFPPRHPADSVTPARTGRMAVVSAVLRSVIAMGAVAAVIVSTTIGAPSAPGYLAVSDEEAVAAALDTGSGFGTTRPDDGSTAATDPGPTTTVPVSTVSGVVPGPFDPRAKLLVDPTANVDPTTVRGRPLRVMLAGDSVGWSLGWDLGPGVTDGVQISDRAIIGCGVMPPTAQWVVGTAEAQDYGDLCDKQEEAERIGLSEAPDVVLLWVGAWEVYDHEYQGRSYAVGTKAYAELLDSQLQARIDKFRAVGVPSVLPLVPCFGENAPRLGLERYDAHRIRWVNARLREVAARNRGWVRMIDPDPQLCTSDGVAVTETADGVPIRADGAHFDQRSAEWFWNTWLAGQLGAVFAPAPPG